MREGISQFFEDIKKENYQMKDNVHYHGFKHLNIDEATLIKSLSYKSITYAKTSIITLKKNNEIKFYELIELFSLSNTFGLLVAELRVNYFDEHLHCYIVSQKYENFITLTFSEITHFPQSFHKLSNGSLALQTPSPF